MAITESKNKNGVLTLGGTAFETQATNVTITPGYEEVGDPIETLAGDTQPAQKERTDVLKITAIQDFDDPDGFVHYTWDNDLAQVAFSWLPNGATAGGWSGTVEVLACEVGGDVNTRLTTETEWTCIGKAVVVPAP